MKIGLVAEGGGMKCAYTSGVLDRFLDDDIHFDYNIGVSAGSACIASYLAGQRDRNLRFYTTHIHEKGYFGFDSFLKTGNLFGLSYIYETLTNSDGADPLDFDAIVANPGEFVVVATDAETGKPHYFYKKNMKKDQYKEIMASCALPAACRPQIVDGRAYYDGGVSDSIPINRALEDGCDKVVVITTKPRDFVKTPEKPKLVYSFLCRKYPKIVEALDNRHITYMETMHNMFELEKQGKVLVIAPSKHLEMGTYEMDEKNEMALYELGVEDYENAKEKLAQFLKK